MICFWQSQLGLWHISCNFKTVQIFFQSHHAELLIADRCPGLHFAFLTKSSPLVIYLVKNLRLVSSTNTTSSFDNFKYFFSLRVFLFLLSFIISFTIVSTTNKPSLCHLIIENLLKIRRSSRLIIFIFLFSWFKKIYLHNKINIHNTFAEKFFNMVICSWLKLSLLITSPKTSSTLKIIVFIISFLLSRYWL